MLRARAARLDHRLASPSPADAGEEPQAIEDGLLKDLKDAF